MLSRSRSRVTLQTGDQFRKLPDHRDIEFASLGLERMSGRQDAVIVAGVAPVSVTAVLEPVRDRRNGASHGEELSNGHFGISTMTRCPRRFFAGGLMSRRKIEIHHYRQALKRMRQGDSDRDIAKSGLMGRRTTATLRTLAGEQG